MLICLQDESDFNRIWLREVWFLDGFPMRTFRWSPNFRLDAESSIVPIWISLSNIPPFLFNKIGLFSIDSILGKPLALDDATANLSRPSEARLCVEVDLLKRLPHRIWLDCESIGGLWQKFVYENLPSYCKHYKRLGHEIFSCKIANLDLTKKPPLKEQHVPKSAQHVMKSSPQ